MKTVHHGITDEGAHSRRFTIVGKYDKEDPLKVNFGVAICRIESPRDQFCKKVGRTIAEGRAKENPTLVKEIKLPIPETKEGKKQLLQLGYELVEKVTEAPYIFQEILTDQYKDHKKIHKHR